MKLKEENEVDELVKKWWEDPSIKHKIGDCKPEDDKKTDESLGLGLQHVGGVFLVLLGGLLISVFIGIIEFLWNVKKVSIDEKVVYRKYPK